MKGKIPEEILDSFLESLPIEFSILDKDDKVLAWNKHQSRVFKRPESVIGRDVRDCHPKKSLHKVEQIIDEMKSGERNKARFWIDMKMKDKDQKEKILIEYYAIRDDEENYLGCLEASRKITDIQDITGEKKLLD
ncbi:MAG: PAS domain-containing protein [Candidatus Thermoplasmatota archaeon]